MYMTTLRSQQEIISGQLSSLLQRVSIGENEATESITLLEKMPLSCDVPMSKAITQDQAEKHHVVTDGTLRRSEYSSSGHWWTRSGSDPQLPTTRYTFPKRQTCSSWCSCVCHMRQNFASPGALFPIIGQLRVQYNGRSRFPCRCSESSWFNASYQFPPFLLLRYVSLAVRSCPIPPPEYVLRVSRVLPPYHPLWRYSITGDIVAVRNMYSEGVASPYDLHQKNGPALFYAVEQSTPGFARFLLDQGVDSEVVNTAGVTASELLWDRAFAGRYGADGAAIVRKLLPGDDSVEDMGFTTLHKIILGFVYKDLRTVLEASADSVNTIDSRGRTPLHWAVLCDDDSATQQLLNYGADPNIIDREGFAAIDHVTGLLVCTMLLEAKANLHKPSLLNKRCALQQALKRNAPVETIEILITAGGGIDLSDTQGGTALLNAMYYGDTEIIAILISYGANVNATTTSSRQNSIKFAAVFDRSDVLPLLLNSGADYTALDIHGQDLGHFAAIFAGTEFIKVMTRCDLSNLRLDVPDKAGKTAKDHMHERIILADREIGVHEAFESLVASLAAVTEASEEDMNLEKQLDFPQPRTPDLSQIPGAFPM